MRGWGSSLEEEGKWKSWSIGYHNYYSSLVGLIVAAVHGYDCDAFASDVVVEVAVHDSLAASDAVAVDGGHTAHCY